MCIISSDYETSIVSLSNSPLEFQIPITYLYIVKIFPKLEIKTLIFLVYLSTM